VSGSFDPYHVWLGIPPEEQPPDHYRLLGIPALENNPDVIENAADQRMAHLRTFQGSRLGYAIPKGSKSFSAVGYCAAPGDVAFQVEVDGQRVFSSGKARVARVLVDLPAKGKTLGLIVDNLGRGDLDHSFWLLPRFHAKAAAQVGQIDAAEKVGKLTALKPVSASVGAGELLVNRVPEWAAPPLHVLELTPCDEFIFAHAPSRAVFAIPPGAKEFSAVGYCVASCSVQFQVLVDGKPRFTSPKAGIVPIRVPLPRGTKRLELAVDSLGDNHWDSSFWCYPRIWW